MHLNVILFHPVPLVSITSAGMQITKNYFKNATIPSINLKEGLYNNP